jgi:ATP-grasp domain, R2K clade family 3
MRHVVLYRAIDTSKEELAAIKEAGFFATDLRPDIKDGDLCVGRFSLHPYYADQEREIKYVGARLINTHSQHLYVADLMNWVNDLGALTPRTWEHLHEIPDDGTQFVLKGATNSKKDRWKTHMFAKNKAEAIQVHSRLLDDGLISHQSIYIREYVPLVSYATSISGCPISKEFRFFVLYGEILTGGYYWSIMADDEITKPSVSEVPQEFLDEVLRKIADKIPFYAVDVAQAKDGHWLVIEVNDGGFAGNSDADLKVLYQRLKAVLNKHHPESQSSIENAL